MTTRTMLSALVLGAIAGAACARPATFNFESVSATATTYGASGALVSLTMTDSGVTTSLTRDGTIQFDVMDLSGQVSPFGFPAGWGSNCLSPFADVYPDGRFRAAFTGAAVYGFAIEFGDFGQDSGDVHFDVYDTSNALITSDAVFWNGNLGLGDLGSWSYSGTQQIGAVTFWGEFSTFPMSLYWDNMTLDTGPIVPLPTGAALGAAGLALVASRRRR